MKILMVCLGNICRSPMAEGILRHKLQERGLPFTTESAGTAGSHVGEAPDRRAIATMRRFGIDISDLRARQVSAQDFARFDHLLAMDEENLLDLRALAPDHETASRARLIMDLVPDHPLRHVPDPYYGGDVGFDTVYHMLDQACDRLIERTMG